MINKVVGLRIREIRESRKMTQEKFSNLVEASRTYIAEVETGKRNISVDTLYRIVSALGMTMTEFFSVDCFDQRPEPEADSTFDYYVTKL